MRKTTILGGFGAAATIVAAACVPPAPDARIDNPAYCGQTQDAKAVVAEHVNAGLCTRQLGQKLILVAEPCGPLFNGSNALDDCWRGNVPGRPSPDNFRLGTIQLAGGQALNIVASDATAW